MAHNDQPNDAGTTAEERLEDTATTGQLTDETATEQDAQVMVDGLENQVAELKDRNLRLLADFENTKKRHLRERLELMDSAGASTMKALLPVLDDFDRARNGEGLSDGVMLVYKKLYDNLAMLGLEEMDSTGAAFDPDLHEALTEIPATTPDAVGKVVDTIDKGYSLKGKILRHAKVVVGK